MTSFESIRNNKNIYLYAGDLSKPLLENKENKFVGLSIEKTDKNHISFDITNNRTLGLIQRINTEY